MTTKRGRWARRAPLFCATCQTVTTHYVHGWTLVDTCEVCEPPGARSRARRSRATTDAVRTRKEIEALLDRCEQLEDEDDQDFRHIESVTDALQWVLGHGDDPV